MQNKSYINTLTNEVHPTKQKLIDSSKIEFFEKGYLKASLRNICTKCKVTTGAFYFFFPSKEALFCTIVDPVISEWKNLMNELVEEEKKNPSSAMDNDKKIMEFEMKNRMEILILLEKCEGSCYENFRSEIFNVIKKHFIDYFTLYLGHSPKLEVVEMLVNLRIETNINILKGACNMEQALLLNEIMACYADGGFKNLINKLKDKI